MRANLQRVNLEQQERHGNWELMADLDTLHTAKGLKRGKMTGQANLAPRRHTDKWVAPPELALGHATHALVRRWCELTRAEAPRFL